MDAPARLQAFLDHALAGRDRLDLLEAGCGSATHLSLPAGVRTFGIDISQRQLMRHPGLHGRLRADLETVALRPESFDLVICWNVLEHLPHPEKALARLAGVLRPGGLLVLGLPNPASVKGIVTRLLPYRLHVFVYRTLHGNPNAGRDDAGPFPTYMRWSITASAIRRFAARHGFGVVHDDSYDVADLDYFRRSALAGFLYRAGRKLASVLSFGRLGDSELILVLSRT